MISPDLDDILPVYQECFRTTRELQGEKRQTKTLHAIR